MKALVLLLVVSSVTFAAKSPAASPVGSYRSAGGTEIITLALLANGNYLARWDIDIWPEHGRATGTWQLVGDEVRLNPKSEEGGLQGHLRVLLVRTVEGKKALLRKEDILHEKNPFFYFYIKEHPDQSSVDCPETAPNGV
jgi:hypothetical protein